MDPCKCPRCRKETCKRYKKNDPSEKERTASNTITDVSGIKNEYSLKDNVTSTVDPTQRVHAPERDSEPVVVPEPGNQTTGGIGKTENNNMILPSKKTEFEKNEQTNTPSRVNQNQQGREIGTNYSCLSSLVHAANVQASTAGGATTEQSALVERTAQYDTIMSMYTPPSDTARTSSGGTSSVGFDPSDILSQTNTKGFESNQEQCDPCLLPHSCLTIPLPLPTTKVSSTNHSMSLPVTPNVSLHTFNIPIPKPSYSDYAITVNLSLHDNSCNTTSPNLPTTIQLNFETTNKPNANNDQLDAAFNNKDSTHCCTNSGSEYSSYHSANKSSKSSCNCFANYYEKIQAQLIDHLSGGCDASNCRENKRIKQLSNIADNTTDVTSLYRCPCSVKSSQLSVPSVDKPITPLISMKRNEKNCGSPNCLSTVTFNNTDTQNEFSHFRLKRENEDVSSVKKINIDLKQQMEEMENEKTKNANLSSDDSFDSDQEVVLPGVRVNIGPEKLKSIHIDVTPADINATSSGVITIPVQLRFNRKSDFEHASTLKYDDKTIKAYYKQQKLLFENCTECSEYIDQCTGETIEPVIEKINSDMDFVNVASKSQESVFVKEVSHQQSLRKSKKKHKINQLESKISNTVIDIEPWCHRSTYIEPYLRFEPCLSLDTVEVQTDLSLGPKLLSESLNSSIVDYSDKKSSTSLKIPWEKYELPKNTLEIFPSQMNSKLRREIFPQPEELIEKETPPVKTNCFSFMKRCCKKKTPEPTTCARPKLTGQLIKKPKQSNVDTTYQRSVAVNNIEESRYQAPEPRPRPYRPPRSYKGRNKILQSDSSVSIVVLKSRESIQSIPKTRRRVTINSAQNKKKRGESNFSSNSELDKHYDVNTGEMKTSQYISLIGTTEKAVQEPTPIKRWSSQSCNSQSSYKFIDHNPSFYNNGRITSSSRSLQDQYEVTKDTNENRPNTQEKLKFSRTKKNCCPDHNGGFCMELPPKVLTPTRYNFVYLNQCALHEPYLNKLHKENIVKRTGDSLPWEDLILPKNIKLRKIPEPKFDEPQSDKMVQFGSNSPTKLFSLPNITTENEECEQNSVKFAVSSPIPCACHQKIPTDFNKVIKNNKVTVKKPTEPTNLLIDSGNNFCTCCQNCKKEPTNNKIQIQPTCQYANTKKASSLFLKPDPVIAAFQKCEAELKPVKETLAQLKNSLKNLNMPELDCLFKRDESNFEFPMICKRKKQQKMKKTQHFYTNTTCTAILAEHRKYWHLSSSSSSEKCDVRKRNKGIQKGSSIRRKPKRKTSKINCNNCIHRSNYLSTSTDCSPCTSEENIKVSDRPIDGRLSEASIIKAIKSILLQSTTDDHSPCTSKQVKHRCTSPQRSKRPKSREIESCPIVQAIKSILLKSSESTQTSRQRQVKKMKINLRFKDKHEM